MRLKPWTRRLSRLFCVAGLVALGASLLVPEAAGHALAPALLELRCETGGEVSLLWRRPVLLPAGARPEPLLPSHCRALEPAVERVDGVAVERHQRLDCGTGGLGGATLGVSGLERVGSEALLRVVLPNGETVRAVLRPGAASYRLPRAPQGWLEVGRGYLRLGVSHLFTGWDHLTFVLGLVLLVSGRRRLVATVTAFTLGHSLTLSLATLGYVHLPSAPIEALIAVSIVVLAAELMRTPRSFLGEKPWWMAAGFGLLHGLGFAGALSEVGLPAGEIPLALASFNLGIELGQLLVVALLVSLGMVFTSPRLETARPQLPRWCHALPAYGIGSLAAFWTFERLVGW